VNLIATAILAPLSTMTLILLLRRLPATLALVGAAAGLLASLGLLSNAFHGTSDALILPGLPDMPLRLITTPLTALLSTLVAVISTLVLVYAVGYMKQDDEKIRFFATMLLFISAMQTLVLAGDWILLLAAWELIGLSSYLLIGFWYRRPSVRSAATRAFLTTRSADLGLYVAVFMLIANAGSSDIATTLNTGGNTAVVAGLLLLLAAMGKSAQTPLHDWLQRAMAGPTPVSALLHLIAHAAIKSSLFLGAGVFQHSRESTAFTDLEGAGRDRPRIFFGFVLAALALAGIPPLSGFFSKDAIIAASLASPNAWVLASFALAGTLLTGAYMARALRILWRGDRQPHEIAGLGWMGAGLAGLVSLAVILGAAFPSIESLLHTTLSENTLAQILGLSAALGGLTLGWFTPGRRLLGPLLPWAQQGFAIAGGFDTWMVRPALAIARRCEQLERGLYNAALAVGQFSLDIGRVVRRSDDHGIDGLIFSLVRGTVELGKYARTLQSGLIHREMAITVVGTAIIFAALLAGLLI